MAAAVHCIYHQHCHHASLVCTPLASHRRYAVQRVLRFLHDACTAVPRCECVSQLAHPRIACSTAVVTNLYTHCTAACTTALDDSAVATRHA
eukprot:16490-Heterococcus_DN1.PRE.2